MLSVPDVITVSLGDDLSSMKFARAKHTIKYGKYNSFTYGGFRSASVFKSSECFEAVCIVNNEANELDPEDTSSKRSMAIGDIFEISESNKTLMFFSVFMLDKSMYVAYISDIDDMIQRDSFMVDANKILKYKKFDECAISFWASLKRCDQYEPRTLTSLRAFAAKVRTYTNCFYVQHFIISFT